MTLRPNRPSHWPHCNFALVQNFKKNKSGDLASPASIFHTTGTTGIVARVPGVSARLRSFKVLAFVWTMRYFLFPGWTLNSSRGALPPTIKRDDVGARWSGNLFSMPTTGESTPLAQPSPMHARQESRIISNHRRATEDFLKEGHSWQRKLQDGHCRVSANFGADISSLHRFT